MEEANAIGSKIKRISQMLHYYHMATTTQRLIACRKEALPL